jgi:hypothetical protein
MPATADAVYAIHAVVNVGTKEVPDWQQAGRLDVFTRTPKTYSVTLVPMGGTVPDATAVKTALDGIWNPYGISWTVNVETAFYNKSATDEASKARVTLINGIVGTGLEAGDKWPSEYSPQQKAINIAYRDYALATNYSKETMYVFVLPAIKAPSNEQLGDMPLGKQWGYLYCDAVDTRTLAHELGHGKTKLDHTFKGGQIDEGTTTNLMDYCSLGEVAHDSLVRQQWEAIHNPAIFDPAQSDEDGAAFGDNKGDIVVVGRDTVKLNEIVFDQYSSFTKQYYFLKNNEELSISIFRMKKGIYEPYKVMISCGGSKPIEQDSYTRPVIKSDQIVLSLESKTVYIKTTNLNYSLNTNAGTTEKPEKFEINQGFTLYGDEKISLLGSSSEYPAVSMLDVIDTIRCGENILSDGFNNWVDLQLVPDANGNAVIQVIPIIGSKREYTIKLEDAPFLTISDINGSDANEKEHRLGLDNYELYKKYDNAGKSVNYIYKFDNGNKYMPYLLMTEATPEKIKFILSTYEQQRVNGLCNYNFTFTNTGNINPDPKVLKNNFTLEHELKIPTGFKSDTTVMNRKTCTLKITDNLGNIKGMVLFVSPKIDKTIQYNTITLTYGSKTGSVKAGSQDYLNESHQQLGIAWNLASTTKFEITDDMIKSRYDFISTTVFKNEILKYLKDGTSSDSETYDFIQVLGKLAEETIAIGSTTHTVFYLPCNLHTDAGVSLKGTIFAFMCPQESENHLAHEFGHLLGLEGHIWENLNYTGIDEKRITNNIMGYNHSAIFSFWNWQKNNLK